MARSAAAKVQPVPTIGTQIDVLFQTREEIRALNKQIDELKNRKAEIEGSLMDALDAQGIDKSSGAVATASISSTVVPQVEDWDKFYRFIQRNKAMYLLERRPAAAPYRELLEQRQGRVVPGVVSFAKRTINLRKR